MPGLRAPVALLLLSAAAGRAEQLQPLIQRPLTLPHGTVDLTLQGTYTNWASDPAAAPGTAWRPGESLVLAVDFGMPGDPGGVIDATQLGFAVAMPVHPGAGWVPASPVWSSPAVRSMRSASTQDSRVWGP